MKRHEARHTRNRATDARLVRTKPIKSFGLHSSLSPLPISAPSNYLSACDMQPNRCVSCAVHCALHRPPKPITSVAIFCRVWFAHFIHFVSKCCAHSASSAPGPSTRPLPFTLAYITFMTRCAFFAAEHGRSPPPFHRNPNWTVCNHNQLHLVGVLDTHFSTISHTLSITQSHRKI